MRGVAQAAVPGDSGGRPAVRDLQKAERGRRPGRTRLPGRTAAVTAGRVREAIHGAGERTVSGKEDFRTRDHGRRSTVMCILSHTGGTQQTLHMRDKRTLTFTKCANPSSPK